MSNKSTRDHIVEAADQLFYQQGYDYTSFTDIADAVQISRGNFYYHFKSKDEILIAVINKRLADREGMLEQWKVEGENPEDHIRSFINILRVNRTKIKNYGCPIGTLSTELAKLNHPSQAHANQIFMLFRTWLRDQFMLLGCAAEADELAMHLLARSQGVSTLATAFQDDKFIEQEIEKMYDWLSACAANPTNIAHTAQGGV